MKKNTPLIYMHKAIVFDTRSALFLPFICPNFRKKAWEAQVRYFDDDLINVRQNIIHVLSESTGSIICL